MAYEARLEAGWTLDPAQQAAVGELSRLLGVLSASPRRPVKGLYLHGPVGRGKSQLLNMFMQHLGPVPARRIHMHSFMAEIHQRLFDIKAGDPVVQTAREMAAEAKVLGFDEFYVTNIADAMLLGRLFEHLFKNGVAIVATSNWPMAELYQDGRNRKSFVPFLRILERNLHAIDLGDGQDYRQSDDPQWPLYLIDGPGTPGRLTSLFEHYATGETGPAPEGIEARAFKGSCGWYRFADLCEQPLGRLEYLDLVRHVETLIVEGIPLLGPQHIEAVLRFVTLIDICYEHRRRVIVTAAEYPEALCSAGPVVPAFRRATSRLAEMQGWV